MCAKIPETLRKLEIVYTENVNFIILISIRNTVNFCTQLFLFLTSYNFQGLNNNLILNFWSSVNIVTLNL